MYYELYVDVFFLVNFTMDFLLLLLAKDIKMFCHTRKYLLGKFVWKSADLFGRYASGKTSGIKMD